MTNPIWPATASDWRATFERGLGLDPKAAAYRHAHGELEPDVFVAWIEVEYDESRGYHPDFVPALTRNIEGLLAWAYGDGPEPYWPGSDGDLVTE
jgi:hypothetical protein